MAWPVVQEVARVRISMQCYIARVHEVSNNHKAMPRLNVTLAITIPPPAWPQEASRPSWASEHSGSLAASRVSGTSTTHAVTSHAMCECLMLVSCFKQAILLPNVAILNILCLQSQAFAYNSCVANTSHAPNRAHSASRICFVTAAKFVGCLSQRGVANTWLV